MNDEIMPQFYLFSIIIIYSTFDKNNSSYQQTVSSTYLASTYD